jgi:hypothetical protein
MVGLEDSPREEAIGVLAGLMPVEDGLDAAEPEENLPGCNLLLRPPPPQLSNVASHLCPPSIRRRHSTSCYSAS